MSLTSGQLESPPQGSSSSQPAPSTADAVQYEICLRVYQGKMGLMVGLGKSTIAFCLSRQRRLESETTLPVFYRDIASLFRSVQVARRHSEPTWSSEDVPSAAMKALRDTIQADYLPTGRFVVHDCSESFRSALKGGLQLQHRLGHSGYEGLACVEDDPEFGRGRAGISLMVDMHHKPEEMKWQIRDLGARLSDRYSEDLQSEYHNSGLRDAKAILLSVLGYLTEDLSETQWAELTAARERDHCNRTMGYHSEGSALRARWLDSRWRAMRKEEGAGLGSLKIRMYSDARVWVDARRAASIMVGDSSSLDPSLTPALRGLDLDAEDEDEGTL